MLRPAASDMSRLPACTVSYLDPNSTDVALKVELALIQVLASPQFRKAQRTSRLLRFLVEKALLGAVRETSEYAIGIEVFDRDPASYNTCEDPIVRVQIGRLRLKLKSYYATAPVAVDVQIVIPLGSYMPVVQKTMAEKAPALPRHLLALLPLLHVAQDLQSAAFTHGASEELAFQLFQAFGDQIVSHTFAGISSTALHLLEGSIRITGDLMRVSLRLVDADTGAIVWSEQFDRGASVAIRAQEELAILICQGLKTYLTPSLHIEVEQTINTAIN